LPRLDKHTLQTLGFALIIVGLLLLLITLLRSSVTNCPVNGCPPDVISRLYWQSAIAFYSGIALIIIGIILLIVARGMKPTQEPDTTLAQHATGHDVELGFHCGGKLIVSCCDQSYRVVGSGMESERVSIYQ
jgi:uncharacterized membrane protein